MLLFFIYGHLRPPGGSKCSAVRGWFCSFMVDAALIESDASWTQTNTWWLETFLDFSLVLQNVAERKHNVYKMKPPPQSSRISHSCEVSDSTGSRVSLTRPSCQSKPVRTETNYCITDTIKCFTGYLVPVQMCPVCNENRNDDVCVNHICRGLSSCSLMFLTFTSSLRSPPPPPPVISQFPPSEHYSSSPLFIWSEKRPLQSRATFPCRLGGGTMVWLRASGEWRASAPGAAYLTISPLRRTSVCEARGGGGGGDTGLSLSPRITMAPCSLRSSALLWRSPAGMCPGRQGALWRSHDTHRPLVAARHPP